MRVGLGYRQQPFFEFINGHWRIWVIYNRDVSAGTFYELFEDGVCDQVTVDKLGNRMKVDRITGVVSNENATRSCFR